MSLEINYWNLAGHEPMLFDSVRCEAFRRALADTVTPGSAVLDIGAGTGILSVFAAQAGARVVYAVERTHIADLARRIVAENGLTGRIRVLQEEMEAVELPEPVDVIVSEWLGGYGVDENLLPIIVQARDRWLKPGGVMIPKAVASWMAPVYDARLQQDVDFWFSRPYGVDLDSVGHSAVRQSICCSNHVKREHLVSEPQCLWALDAGTVTRERAGLPFEARLTFTVEREGPLNALAAWFSAPLSDGVVLSNGPSDPDTHWGRTIFPMGNLLAVKTGTTIEVHFVHEPCGKGRSKASWEVQVGDYSFRSELVTVLTAQPE